MGETERKILIVDDDPDFMEAVSSFLEARGYRVLKARSGREALRKAESEVPDLILMDVVMDERTEGFFTVQEIRSKPRIREIPIFVVSSLYSKTEFQVSPDRDWMAHDEFFSKPVDLGLLEERIRERTRQDR